ncbi:MAG: glutamate formiminotransferase / formiminotetrahydrofolate cyclodeaminase, partial [Actinomycetota bacterium]|nr:glutamate formiminotransferase / formiminotetrahydrofolate cyclodeaminase [Actinomycetota bacterium]
TSERPRHSPRGPRRSTRSQSSTLTVTLRMPLLAIPNVSEGRDQKLIESLKAGLERSGARVLDVHSDGFHNRSVFTIVGIEPALVESLATLACMASTAIDLRTQHGIHPRVGALDVCPIVPHREPMQRAVKVAVDVGRAIGTRCDLPVYLYGEAATEGRARGLPALRRGGLAGLIDRNEKGFRPDFGPDAIAERSGVVCVGARDVLIAFNVWVRGDLNEVRQIASLLRDKEGVRALGLPLTEDLAQISMNLTDPRSVGVDAVFEEIERRALGTTVELVATELVGLVPAEFLPRENARAARMLKAPGRSLESML